MMAINYVNGINTVLCPECQARMSFDPDTDTDTLPVHKRGDGKTYSRPASMRTFRFVPRKPAQAAARSTKKVDRSAEPAPPQRGGARQASASNSNSATRTSNNQKKELTSSQRYKRQVEHLATLQERYARNDFAIWADDSCGSDDIGLGSTQSVHYTSGGKVQLNCSRY